MAGIEKEVEAIIFAGLGEEGEIKEGGQMRLNTTEGKTEQEAGTERKVIDVDLYRLPGGAVLLVPGQGNDPLDTNAVESDAAPPETTVPLQTAPGEDTATEQEDQQEGTEPAISKTPTVPLTRTQRRVKPSFAFVPLLIALVLATCAASYFYILPITASATITITPNTRTLRKNVTLAIAAHPNGSQVQGKELAPFSATESKTVAATGHAHQDATQATGVITLYNADSQSITVLAGVTFTAPSGATIVTDEKVTIQAAVPPEFGSAITLAHVVQAGSLGNLPAYAIDTRCCGSVFVTAINTAAFSGGLDERNYTYVQRSDIQNAATDLLNGLTPKVSAVLNREMQKGENLVTPLCTPHTISSANEGTEAASVTVSVTQTCDAVVYSLDSLEQVATTLLARSADLAHYAQIETVQVTVNASTYIHHMAALKVSLSGVWVYRFSPQELTSLAHLIARKTQAQATQLLEDEQGVQHASVKLSRLDFKEVLPADPSHIHIVFFVIAQP